MTKLRIAVLISGGGTTLRNLLQWQAEGKLLAEVCLVVSSSASAGGLRFAEEANIPAIIAGHSRQLEAFSATIFNACREADVDLVVMGGFLKRVIIPEEFQHRVINIHPSLIPAFCGEGFYGRRVHQAVLDYGAKLTGCTVHFCDDEYDHGPIVMQQAVPVADDDTAETLAARVFTAECELLPTAVNLFAENKLKIDGRIVKSSK